MTDPIASARQVLGALLDMDTLAELAAVMAEPDEAAALEAIDAMRLRFEQRMVANGVAAQDAAKHARHVAERLSGAWTTLHRTTGRA